MNGFDIKPSEEILSDPPYDSLYVLHIDKGEEIVFKDDSAPSRSIHEWSWDLNADGVIEFDAETFRMRFTQLGLYKVVMCINGPDLCVSKYFYVSRPGADQFDENPLPMVMVRYPENFERISVSPLDFAANVKNVESEDYISLYLNGRTVDDFSFDGEMIETSFANLQSGQNDIILKVENDVGTKEETITVFYNRTIAAGTPVEEKPVSVKRPKKEPVKNRPPKTNSPKKDSPKKDPPKKDPPKPKVTTAPTPTVVVEEPEEEEFLTQRGSGGLSLGKHNDFYTCADFKSSSFSVQITPTQSVELLQFKFFTDRCGGMKVRLEGPDGSQQATSVITQGRNQFSFGDIDARLKAGITYTLSCSAFANYGGCKSDEPPRFEDARDCDDPGTKPAQLKLDYQGSLILYDLKFFY